jgi:hypothetical protein
MNEYQDKLSGLSAKLKAINTPRQLQEVKPLPASKEKEPEEQFMCWLPSSLLQKLRFHCVGNRKSQKAVVMQLLKDYLEEKA